MTFPPSDQAAGVVQPREEAFNDPAPLVAAQGASILRRRAHAIRSMRRDQLDPEFLGQVRIQRVAVIRFVADQLRGVVGDEPVLERRRDEPGFPGRSAGHVHGERKTAAVDDC